MTLKNVFFFFLFFFSSALLAGQQDEKFEISCEAKHSESAEESLKAHGKLTITQRPSKGAALAFDYELLKLPYQAKVEIEFGADTKSDKWKLYFVSTSSSETFGWTEATIGGIENEISIISKTPDASVKLTFSCKIKRLQ